MGFEMWFIGSLVSNKAYHVAVKSRKGGLTQRRGGRDEKEFTAKLAKENFAAAVLGGGSQSTYLKPMLLRAGGLG
jgi:hypothetical protein